MPSGRALSDWSRSTLESGMAGVAFRIGAALLAFAGLGFGIPAAIGAVHYARTGSVWQLWGYPSYDAGLFERWGLSVSPTVLMVAFAVVCSLAVLAAVLLWIPSAATFGAISGLVLIVAQAVFWIGFVLPFGPPLGVLAAIAVVAGLVLRRNAG